MATIIRTGGGSGSTIPDEVIQKLGGVMLVRTANGGTGARDQFGIGEVSLSYSQGTPYSGSWISLFEGGVSEARPDLLVTLSCKNPQSVNGIYFHYVGTGGFERYFKDYYVEYSDDNTSWTRCYNVTAAAYRTGQHIIEHFTASKHKYWRFHYTSSGSNPFSVMFDFIKEVE